MERRVLVTGCCGFVGSMLTEHLLDLGATVCGIDNLMFGSGSLVDLAHRFRFHRIDVRDANAVRSAVHGFLPESVVHLAAIVGAPACHMDPERSRVINVDGTAHVVAAAGEVGAHVVFASTGSVYGSVPSGLCTEDTPPDPLTEYGNSKIDGEAIVRCGAGPWTILRFATAFGLSRRMRLDLLPNDFTWQALHQRHLLVYEGGHLRTFIEVGDMVRAITACIAQPHVTKGEVFNVGDDRLNITKAMLAELVAEIVPGTALDMKGSGEDPDQRNYAVDYSRIQNALGFRSAVGLDEGIRRLVRGYALMRPDSPWHNA